MEKYLQITKFTNLQIVTGTFDISPALRPKNEAECHKNMLTMTIYGTP